MKGYPLYERVLERKFKNHNKAAAKSVRCGIYGAFDNGRSHKNRVAYAFDKLFCCFILPCSDLQRNLGAGRAGQDPC